MDLVIDLLVFVNSKSANYDAILIIVNYLTKIVHYKSVKITVNITNLVKVIINIVVRYQGLPE